MSGSSACHSSLFTASASATSAASTSRPDRSRSSTPGTVPIGVDTPLARCSIRSTIHLSTRLFSPKPGHRKRPSSPRRNQLTKNTLGSFDSSACLPTLIQWFR
ncbi:Uncharacterised protein [Mycobacteroides abscessus subsp. abscessus]|nr:Uncharacterised protein [Mycobacteroides abscessus subsp. abscessus]